jgi:pimeloyl-ACP methyl ester carboxylesterase
MIKTIPFRNSIVAFSDEGAGEAVVLLHGYLENLNIWDRFTERLSPHYRVIRIDIPGHGRSGVVAEIHTMDMMAEAVEAVLQHLDITRCVLVGHSMGGYVSLAYLANHSGRLAGICLFHSSPFADNENKRVLRSKEIKLVEDGNLSLICYTSIPNGFATDNLERFSGEVELAKQIAHQSDPEGVIAILKGMRERPDRQACLQKNTLPLLFILGKKDNFIAFDQLSPSAASFPQASVAVLENSGHSGYFEEPEKSAALLLSFLNKCYRQPTT